MSTTRSAGSPSTRARCSRTCRSGSAAARRRSLRRAVTLADGWCPFDVSIDTAAEWLQAWELPPGFEVVLPADQPLDPVGEPEATEETLRGDGRRAARRSCLRVFIAHSLEHYLEQIHALAELNR